MCATIRPEDYEEDNMSVMPKVDDDLFTRESGPRQSTALAPLQPAQLLALAIERNLDLDKLERLMQLQERWQAQQAKAAYYEALARFQASVPRIPKRKSVAFNEVKYSYAPLGDIDETIRPALLECGLSKRWEILDEGEVLRVTCIVTHAQGHSESTTMQAAPDASGKKNAIQQRGSAITYLQRYTLIGALGLTTADDDIDARLGSDPGETITESQAADLEAMIEEVQADKAKFLKFIGAKSVDEILAARYSKALKALEDKRKGSKK